MSLRIPVSTYRIQFANSFGFNRAKNLIKYLHSLGVTDLYSSPLLKAGKESTHGYDVTDPTVLNPELGTRKEFDELVEELQKYDMGLLLDIVPNHMAASSENPWWQDVLENGLDSHYARYFDINWQPERPGLLNKVMLPILGSTYKETLENRDLTIVLTEKGFCLNYYDKQLPINPDSYSLILEDVNSDLSAGLKTDKSDNKNINEVKQKLWHLYNNNPDFKDALDNNLNTINGTKGKPDSFNKLHKILEKQAYRLAFWQVANHEINYRRFFNINDLVSLHTENETVFAHIHSLVLKLIHEQKVTGLRIDHIDGLYNPYEYLCRLEKQASGKETGGRNFFIIVEKILGSREELPEEWPVFGTTGYDFIKMVNMLLVNKDGSKQLDNLYNQVLQKEIDFNELVYSRKHQALSRLFSSEVKNLLRLLFHLADCDCFGRDLTIHQLEQALLEITASLPIYRTYIRTFTVDERDRVYIENTIKTARDRKPELSPAFDFLSRVLLLQFSEQLSEKQKHKWLEFVMQWQQLTGPVMAKGYEDTSLYIYNRLVSLNEVGGEPDESGVPVSLFHAWNQLRQIKNPHSLNATSTHDTKRSEDVRARINVLSEIPDLWKEHLENWQQCNKSKKIIINDKSIPDNNTELFIYQTLLGAWPLQEHEIPEFKKRLEDYFIKSAREAKIFTNWLQPDEQYENSLLKFVDRILDSSDNNIFLHDFMEFQKITSYFGAFNSLAQQLLKITSPGTPDFYQGSEIWTFSLVDPDNRREVDFEHIASLLKRIQEQEKNNLLSLIEDITDNWKDGRIKLFLTYKTLQFRNLHRQLFFSGEYIPLLALGPASEHICAFLRHFDNSWALTAVPLLLANLETKPALAKLLPEGENWKGTTLLLPQKTPLNWKNVYTNETISADPENNAIYLDDLFNIFPVVLLENKEDC